MLHIPRVLTRRPERDGELCHIPEALPLGALYNWPRA